MSGEAVDSLRKRAQNEATCVALNDLLKQVQAERDQLKEQMPEYDELCYRHGILQSTTQKIAAERDTLRKQLDEAWELLQWATEWNWLDDDAPSRRRIDAWLEANKP